MFAIAQVCIVMECPVRFHGHSAMDGSCCAWAPLQSAQGFDFVQDLILWFALFSAGPMFMKT